MSFVDQDIWDYAYQLFVEEAPELLQTLETGILSMRPERGAAQIHTMMRAAHSLKGNAASLGFEDLKILAHRFEDAIKTLHSDQLEITPELESNFLAACDCLRDAINQGIQTGSFAAPDRAERAFARLEAQLAHVDPNQFDLPSSQDMGIDLRRTLFEVDIARALAELRATQDPVALRLQLKTTAQTFTDLGQMLDLSDFSELSSRIVRALTHDPDLATAVAPLALEAWQATQVAILNDTDPPIWDTFTDLLNVMNIRGETEPDPSGAFDWGEWGSDVEAPKASVDPDLHETSDLFSDLFSEGFFDWGSADELPLDSQDRAVERVEESQPEEPEINVSLLLEPLEQLQIASDTEANPVTNLLPEDPVVAIPVRVSRQSLESVTDQAAELSISRNQLQRQQELFRQTLVSLQHKLSALQKHGIRLDQLAHQWITAGVVADVSGRRDPADLPWVGWQQDFDPLELDRYSSLTIEIQEILESVAQINETAADLTLYLDQSEQTLRQHALGLKTLNDDLMAARMVPLGKVFERFPRIVRDLAVAQGKEIQFQIQGSQVLVDKPVLDQLYTPLLHILRNGVDHGIEPPAERQAKPRTAQLSISAYRQGGQVVIQIKDDGRGIDRASVKQRALDQKVLSSSQLALLTDPDLLDLIFAPGFTTAARVSDISGRGVGLDVVRTQITALKGSVSVSSEPGRGTSFTLRIPLTLGLAQLTLCATGRNTYAFPVDTITEIVQVSQGSLTLEWCEQSVPILPLAQILRFGEAAQALVPAPRMPQDLQTVLIFERDGRAVGLGVDALVAQQELAVRPLGSELSAPDYYYGFTVGATGVLIPVLDGWRLGIKAAEEPSFSQPSHLREHSTVERPRLMVIEDSLVMRGALVQQLEQANYEVAQAKDGQDALEQLQHLPPVMLILCDVEMPRMNGFEFLHHRRQSDDLKRIPVVMLTSRSGKKHRLLAQTLGANAYLSKPCLQFELLSTIEGLLKR